MSGYKGSERRSVYGLASQQRHAMETPGTNPASMLAVSPHEAEIRDAVERLCKPFDDAYWLAKDRDGGFPEDFHRAFAEAGFLGIAIPEEFGGSGLGITEAADPDAGGRAVRAPACRAPRRCT